MHVHTLSSASYYNDVTFFWMTSHFVTWSVCLIHQLFKYIHIHCLPSICGFGDIICSTLWTPRVPTYCIVKCSVHWWILSWNSWTNNKMYIVQSVQCTLHCTIPSFSFLFLLYNALYIPHEDLYRLVHETFSCLNSLLCDFSMFPLILAQFNVTFCWKQPWRWMC